MRGIVQWADPSLGGERQAHTPNMGRTASYLTIVLDP